MAFPDLDLGIDSCFISPNRLNSSVWGLRRNLVLPQFKRVALKLSDIEEMTGLTFRASLYEIDQHA